MNDRFKFRCLNKKTNEIFFVYSFDKNFIQATPSSVVPSIRRFNIDDCIIMQCTGLKDKNGKLIYEGDIVKSDFKFFTITINPLAFKVGDVVFSELFGGWVINSKDKAAPYQQAHLGKIEAQNCEVIGNIYENKELLED